MHSFGQKIWTAQYDSNGTFKRETNRIDYWNFAWQYTMPVNFTIEPADELQTFCVFNTSKWNEPVTFGLSSFQEMCKFILLQWNT